jgi:hypothetical protein
MPISRISRIWICKDPWSRTRRAFCPGCAQRTARKNRREAMRAAGLDLDEHLLCELKTLIDGIARKINAA